MRNDRKNAGKEKRPPKLDRAAVHKAALHYLERYAASRVMLTRTLMRRIERAERRGGTVDREAAEAVVRAVVERCVEAGLVDDRDFAEAKAVTLRRRGESARAVRQKLAQKGVDADLAEAALAAVDRDVDRDVDGNTDWPAELAAAHAYARRRRIGPYRPAERRPENRERDLAALARRGFSYDIAKTVIDGDGELV